MTVTDTMHKMMDDITEEDKKRVRELVERGAGSPYHRTLLAIFRDYERTIAERFTRDDVVRWLRSFANEVSRRGQERGSPKDITAGAQAATAIRDTADVFEHSNKGAPDQLEKLLSCMGDLSIEEASRAIQQHAPWNGKESCDADAEEG